MFFELSARAGSNITLTFNEVAKKLLGIDTNPISKSEIKGFEALNYYEWDICHEACSLGKKNKMPVYRFVKNAIIRKYGEDFYQQLEMAYEAWKNEQPK